MHEEASPCFSYTMSASRVINKDKAGTKLNVMYIYTGFEYVCPVLPYVTMLLQCKHIDDMNWVLLALCMFQR